MIPVALMEKLNRYPMRAYPNPSLAEAEGVPPFICASAKLFGTGALDGAVFISNRFLVQCPAEAGLIAVNPDAPLLGA